MMFGWKSRKDWRAEHTAQLIRTNRKRDPIELVATTKRHCAWNVAAILVVNGMKMEDAAVKASKLRDLVDDALREEYRRDHPDHEG